ncbi:MAG: NUDIX domain-containing protein [Phycisphaerales bacterium JB040]
MPDPHIELIARGVLVRDARILVCRNIKGGYSYLPGGHVEFGEPAALSLAREVAEETGLRARVGGMLLCSEHTFTSGKGRTHHEVNLVFELLGVQNEAGDDAADVASVEPEIAFDWVELAALHETDLRPGEIKAWLMADGELGHESPIGWLSACDPGLVPDAAAGGKRGAGR